MDHFSKYTLKALDKMDLFPKDSLQSTLFCQRIIC